MIALAAHAAAAWHPSLLYLLKVAGMVGVILGIGWLWVEFWRAPW